MNRLVVVGLCIAIGIVGVTRAAADDGRSMAREILAISYSPEGFQNSVILSAAPLLAQMRRTNAARAAAAERSLPALTDKIRLEMISELELVLTQNFSEEELIEVRDFIRSGVGQKWALFVSGTNKAFLEINVKYVERLMLRLVSG